MSIDFRSPRLSGEPLVARVSRRRPAKFMASLVAAALLLYGGPAAACLATCIGLTVENELDANGYITVVDGSKVEVAWEVLQNDDKLLSRYDRIQLLRASDDSVVSWTERGKGKAGVAFLKVKDSAGEELYVRYRVKRDGSFPAQTPDLLNADRIPLLSIAKASLADLTLRVNALETAGADNVAHVAPSGADYTDPVTAMDDLASWCDSPTGSSPCLLKIMPGTYQLGSSQLVMQDHVDIEGSGERVTRLLGTVPEPIDSGGVVVGADAELRNLTVENRGAGGQSGQGLAIRAGGNSVIRQVSALSSGFVLNIGIYQPFSQGALVSVTVVVSGSGTFNRGIYSGGGGSAPRVIGAKVTVSGASTNYALLAINVNTIQYHDVDASASDGTASALAFGGSGNTITVTHSRLSSSGDAIDEGGNTSSTIRVGHTHLDGTVDAPNSTLSCAFVSDGAFAELNGSCQ